MDETRFWQIIGASRSGAEFDEDALCEKLRSALAMLPPDEIVSFNTRLWELIDRAYDWNLWGAAYVAQGGCSDDGFEYFRAWLIGQGREAYQAVTANPDKLADYLSADDGEPGDLDCELLLGVAWDAYRDKTGADLPMEQRTGRDEPSGEEWDFEDEAQIRKRLPRVFEKATWMH